MKIWLDDIRPAPEGWVWCRTYEKFVWYLDEFWCEVELVSLDHDLGQGRTGYDAMCYIERRVLVHGLPLMEVRFHTANPVGRMRMEAAYRRLLERLE